MTCDYMQTALCSFGDVIMYERCVPQLMSLSKERCVLRVMSPCTVGSVVFFR